MPKLLVRGGRLACSMGTSSAVFGVAPGRDVDGVCAPAGNVDDTKAMNIPSFAMCQSMQNPEVASATAAAQGTLTPQPCSPNVAGPWSPGSASVEVAGRPAIHDGCQCECAWGGSISVSDAGQGAVDVD